MYVLCVNACAPACICVRVGVLGRNGGKDGLSGGGLRPEKHKKFK